MNQMIEKYIYAVTKRCPSENRDEIKKELEANILDMLGDNTSPTDHDIDVVLHTIGNPIYVASKYQKEEKYVVPPMFYQDFIMILKYVLIGFTTLSIIVSIIVSLASLNPAEPIDFIGELIDNTLTNLSGFLLMGFGLTTLAFWSYSIPKIKVQVDDWLKNWKTKDLMDVPKEEIKIKPSGRVSIVVEMIFALIFSIGFSVLFIAYYDAIAIYTTDNIYPILNTDYKTIFTITIIISNVLMFIKYAYHLKVGYINTKLLIFKAVNDLLSVIITIIIVLLPNFLNPAFYDGLYDVFNIEYATAFYWTNIAIFSSIAIMIGAYIIEWVVTLIKHSSKKKIK